MGSYGRALRTRQWTLVLGFTRCIYVLEVTAREKERGIVRRGVYSIEFTVQKFSLCLIKYKFTKAYGDVEV